MERNLILTASDYSMPDPLPPTHGLRGERRHADVHHVLNLMMSNVWYSKMHDAGPETPKGRFAEARARYYDMRDREFIATWRTLWASEQYHNLYPIFRDAGNKWEAYKMLHRFSFNW